MRAGLNFWPVAFHALNLRDRSMPVDRSSLQALKNLIAEVDLILETCPPLPENRTGRSRELLNAALALADDLIKQAGKVPVGKAGDPMA